MRNKIDTSLLDGFTRGNNIGYYLNNLNEIPDVPGVYAIIMPSNIPCIYLEKGSGGFFKDKDPNVPISVLQSNWVEDTSIIYIGKATCLRKRLSQYFRFGRGEKVGHWGGRYIWQLSNAKDLIVYWKPTLDKDPGIVETELIQSFKQSHNGLRPFANLTK